MRGSESGAALVEYAVVIALIAVVSLLVVGAVGGDAFQLFDAAQRDFPIPAPRRPSR